MRKNNKRKVKTFNELFHINIQKIDNKIEKTLIDSFCYDLKKFKSPYSKNNTMKNILAISGNYLGTFYVNSQNLENVRKTLRFNLEKYYINDITISGFENKFIKVFVLKNDGEKAIVGFTYNDSFSEYFIFVLETENLLFENSIAYYI